MIPEFLLASEKEYPEAWPDWRPKMPWRFGPCLCAPPLSTVWHCEHFVLKILAPFALIVPRKTTVRRSDGDGVAVCSYNYGALAAKKTSRSSMGLSDVRRYCCGVALRYAAYRSAVITYETYQCLTPSKLAERAI